MIYSYHAPIDVLNAHMMHINLNAIFYTHILIQSTDMGQQFFRRFLSSDGFFNRGLMSAVFRSCGAMPVVRDMFMTCPLHQELTHSFTLHPILTVRAGCGLARKGQIKVTVCHAPLPWGARLTHHVGAVSSIDVWFPMTPYSNISHCTATITPPPLGHVAADPSPVVACDTVGQPISFQLSFLFTVIRLIPHLFSQRCTLFKAVSRFNTDDCKLIVMYWLTFLKVGRGSMATLVRTAINCHSLTDLPV